jgi:hypothetical protein
MCIAASGTTGAAGAALAADGASTVPPVDAEGLEDDVVSGVADAAVPAEPPGAVLPDEAAPADSDVPVFVVAPLPPPHAASNKRVPVASHAMCLVQ